MSFAFDNLFGKRKEPLSVKAQKEANEAAMTGVLSTGHGDTGLQFGSLGRAGTGHINKSTLLGR